ncbi:MAG TPA: creatininase family protein [Gemmatimonadaceae bacterium]|nr:creatininase family protein [Gemmatimonadaceae bacterium]
MKTSAGLLAAMLNLASVAAAQRGQTPEQRAEAERRLQAELKMPRPVDALNSVWIEELTWIEVRDALAAGKTTVIIPTGGIEQNGPYVATGKHNVILRGQCESLARRLGNALCAPIIAFVPEGNIDPPTASMRYPGTITLQEATFRALLDDIASSFKVHGFTEIILIGDSGGNQPGLKATAEALNARWSGERGAGSAKTVARYIPEYYDNRGLVAYMNNELGIKEPNEDGWHDFYWITALMMAVDPSVVRYEERVKAGKATINGVSIAPKEKTIAVGKKLIEWRTEQTVKAIEKQRASR